MPQTHDVPPAVREAAAQLALPEPMRRGSLSERYVKCSKPGCRCAEDPKARHGPYYSLTRVVEGQTRSRFLSAEQASLVRKQIESAHRFRRHVGAYWAVCEQWADAQLKAGQPEGQAGIKKNRARRSVRRRHPRGD